MYKSRAEAGLKSFITVSIQVTFKAIRLDEGNKGVSVEEKNQVQDLSPEQGHEGGEESTLEKEVKPGKGCRRPSEARFSRKRD